MAAVAGSLKVCETLGCSNDARLQCPTCIKLGIQGSYFCSQDCFKGSWDMHKKLHKQAKESAQQKNGPAETYNPWPGYIFTGKLRPFPVSATRIVSAHIPRPDYADHPEGFPTAERAIRGSTNIETLSDEDQELLRVACKLGREVLDEAAKAVAIGVTTDEIDRIVHEACIERECYPSPLNYYNFPKSCCTSVNEVICHGIPDQRRLQDGDIMNIDITTYHRGFHGDLNETFFVGAVSDKAKLLVQTTHECLAKAIAAVRPGVRYREMGDIIQKHAQSNGFSVVRSYCGHGIHRLFHTAPSVPHYARAWRDQTWPDNWTSVTQDGRLSAQFEHTLLVTESGCDVLTKRLERDGQPYFMDNL